MAVPSDFCLGVSRNHTQMYNYSRRDAPHPRRNDRYPGGLIVSPRFTLSEG